MKNSESSLIKPEVSLMTTFYVGEEYYGIDVLKVQEVTGRPRVVGVPLAPAFVHGLINLRGQLATAIGLRELLGKPSYEHSSQMSVVCRSEGSLISVIVDQIGDVLEVFRRDYEPLPETIPEGSRKFLKGIYKLDGKLLSVVDVEKIAKELSPLVNDGV